MSPTDIARRASRLRLLGGLIGRLGGLLLILLALESRVGAALLIGIGAAIWLLGHWHYALSHHAYKSPLARCVFCRWAPKRLAPTRNLAVATTYEAAEPKVREERRRG